MKALFMMCMCAFFLAPVVCKAANFRFNEDYLKTIIIEGDIENQDYEKFRDLVLETGSTINRVVIASRGGNVLEAIRIGQLIRKLRLGTSAANPQNSLCKNLGINMAHCTCQSACLLIHSGGIERSGENIGVHRGFLKDGVKDLSFNESKKVSKDINLAIEAYLKEMGLPDSIIEDVLYTTASTIYWLPKDKVKRFLTGYIPEISDWFEGQCGSKNEMLQKSINALKAKDHRMRNIISDQYHRCLQDTQEEATREAFIGFTKEEIQECSQMSGSFDIRDLVGLSLEEARNYLKCYGTPHKFHKTEAEPIIFNGKKLAAKMVGELYATVIEIFYEPTEIMRIYLHKRKIKSVEIDFIGFQYPAFDSFTLGHSITDMPKFFKTQPVDWNIYDENRKVVEDPYLLFFEDGFYHHLKIYRGSGAVVGVKVYE